MPKKNRRGRLLLFPTRPHFDGVAGLAKNIIGATAATSPLWEAEGRPLATRNQVGNDGKRWHPDVEVRRARRKRQRQARRAGR